MPIRQLAPDVAAKIAAGEVVERPASVVKELIENSIDAGAKQIRVDLVNGGLQLIRVTDNGCGISAEELPLALARHATSKVNVIDDLEHIRSLGFRGEALASIAAVADVTLLSRMKGAAQGAQIHAENGKISDVVTAAAAEGTVITVRNLFSAVPARLKFLKSRSTEVSHCHHLLEQYALAYPEIRFSVYSEARQIFATPGDGQLFSVLVAVYGLAIAEQMVALKPLEPEQKASKDETSDTPPPIVTGYISRPTCYKSTRQHISFFVNRRWVISRMLTSAVEGAYHSLLLSGRHPIAVVNIEVDPTLLDVNVHPAKTEIRFLKERRIFATILRTVRATLLEEPEMPQWQPELERKNNSSKATKTANRSITTPTEESSEDDYVEDIAPQETASDSPSFPIDSPWITVTEEENGTRPALLGRLWQSHVQSPLLKGPSISSEIEKPGKQRTLPETESGQAAPISSSSLGAREQRIEQPTSDDVVMPEEPVMQSEQSQESTEQHVLAINSRQTLTTQRRDDSWLPQQPQEMQNLPLQPELEEGRRLPHLRVVGQVAQSYIVAEGKEGSMYLIDQHAAHERILLERMVASLKKREPLSQHLLTPMALELAPGEIEAIEEHRKQLEEIGFAFSSAEDGSLSVDAVPGVLVKHLSARSLQELLVEVTAEDSLGHTETWEERAMANVACKAAIKANYFLTQAEMREMLEQLEQTQAPYSCCHGRPTMVHFSPNALARAFERR